VSKNQLNITKYLDAYKAAAKWQRQAVEHALNVLKSVPDVTRAIASIQKGLNKNNTIPRYAKHKADLLGPYWKQVDARRIFLKQMIRALTSDKALADEDHSTPLVSYFKGYADHLQKAVCGIEQLRIDDVENIHPEQGQSHAYRRYSAQQTDALRRHIMKNTLNLSRPERASCMEVAMQELKFLLTEIEPEWTAWQAGKQQEHRRSSELVQHRLKMRAMLESDGAEWMEDENDGALDAATEPLPDGTCRFRLCNPEEVKAFLGQPISRQKLAGTDQTMLEQVKRQGGMVSLATVPEDYRAALSDFRIRFPNMAELGDLIEGALNLSTLGGTDIPLQLSSGPIIMSGPPGTGKTMGLRYLSDRLGVAFTMIGCAELTNGFDISGSSRGWGTGKPGLIGRMLIRDKAANGIVVLDELDKCHDSQSNFPPTQALFTLLERESAAHFKDEFLDIEMDASRINWLATANDYERIPEPLRDRATRICIAAPTIVQRVSIAGYLYQDLCQQNRDAWGKFFAPELDPAVAWMLASLQDVSIRGMKRALMACLMSVAGSSSGSLDEGSLYVRESDAAKVPGLRPGGLDQSGYDGLIH